MVEAADLTTIDGRIKKNVGDVMVVGAGISGIQAALDLADSGFRVYLIDKAPAIGGHMAQFDKVFPTNECSMCIESPKFLECSRHPNIEILTHTRIDKLEGEAGNYRVTLLKKPRYIIEDKCKGCGACVSYCPVSVPDPFNLGLNDTKAVHIHFDQSVPLVTYIDSSACHFLLERKCNICVNVCKNNAVNLHQKEEALTLEVGAIILSPGYEAYDPGQRAEYGYGKMKNVVTSLEFERILNADGPTKGELVRLSDGKAPEKIAWIQCVGSREVTPGGNRYCSAVCCMYAIKQVNLAVEHDGRLEATIFHNDIRAFGKEFEQYYLRAQELPGVRFVRGYASIAREIPETGNVMLRYSHRGSVKEEEFEMVVLSVGLTPPDGMKELSERLGIELSEEGFCKTNHFNQIETSKAGIFVSGAFAGPKDIPESVTTGSGAAALCEQLLVSRRGELAREKEYPPERDISNEAPKVGVFVCH
jgi:heterodisulfide reductase subunit A